MTATNQYIGNKLAFFRKISIVKNGSYIVIEQDNPQKT